MNYLFGASLASLRPATLLIPVSTGLCQIPPRYYPNRVSTFRVICSICGSAPGQTASPVGRPGRHHCRARLVRVCTQHRVAVTNGSIASRSPSRTPVKRCIPTPRLARFRRTRCRLACEVLCRTRAEDLEGRRSAVLASWIRQPVAIGEHAVVALVADDGRAGTEHVTVAEPSPIEDPVPRRGARCSHRGRQSRCDLFGDSRRE